MNTSLTAASAAAAAGMRYSLVGSSSGQLQAVVAFMRN